MVSSDEIYRQVNQENNPEAEEQKRKDDELARQDYEQTEFYRTGHRPNRTYKGSGMGYAPSPLTPKKK